MAGTRGYAAAILAAAGLQDQRARVLLELAATTATWYWCTGQEPIVYGGDTYLPKPFEIDDITVSTPSDAETSVTVDDGNGAIYAESALNRLSGRSLTITVQVLDEGGAWRSLHASTWKVGGKSGTCGQDVTLKLSWGDGKRPRHGLQEGSRACPHAFKGTRCAYAGADTVCLKTWTDCDSKSNTANFGGLRYAPEPGDTLTLGVTQATFSSPSGSLRARWRYMGTNEHKLGRPGRGLRGTINSDTPVEDTFVLGHSGGQTS